MEFLKELMQISELSVDLLKHYADAAKHAKPGTDLFRAVKHVEGLSKAKKRITKKTGDRTKEQVFKQTD